MRLDREERAGILKVVFGRDADGKFAIETMVPLALLPDGDGEEGFYRIKDDIVVSQPRYVATVLSALGQSIVPIVAMVPGESAMRCLGTGFFISASGLLITAAHVVMDPIERDYGGVRPVGDRGWDISGLNLGVMIAGDHVFGRPGWFFRKIEWASLLATQTDSPLLFAKSELRLTTDTAICKVEAPPEHLLYQPLSIVQPGLRGVGLDVGKSAMAIGYGAMHDVDLEDEGNGIANGDFHFDLYVAKGHILERFPDNDRDKQVRTPGPCFSASLRLPPGMSGSPIFDDERVYVHGVASSGLQDENGPTDFGYGSMLASSMALPIEPLGDRNLIDLLKEGGHGMVRLHIPDA